MLKNSLCMLTVSITEAHTLKRAHGYAKIEPEVVTFKEMVKRKVDVFRDYN